MMKNELFLNSVEFKILKFFFLLKREGSLESIAIDLNLPVSTVRPELSKLEKLELIIGTSVKRIIHYKPNDRHSSYNELHDFLKNYIIVGLKLNFNCKEEGIKTFCLQNHTKDCK